MTTHAHKAAARRYQAEHPGTPLPVALRATAQPHALVALDPLRGTPAAGSSVTRDVLQACLGPDLSPEDLQALTIPMQGRRDRPITMLADQLTQARANGWRIINCTSSPTTQPIYIERVPPHDFSRFARTLVRAREAELHQLNVHDANKLPPNSPLRKILLFIDPDAIDAIDTAVLGSLFTDQRLGMSVHIAQLPGRAPATPATAEQWLGLDQPASRSGGDGPHRALMGGAPGAGKALRYHKAFAVFSDAGCQITPTEDGIAFTITAPEDMTREQFQELTQRAWA